MRWMSPRKFRLFVIKSMEISNRVIKVILCINPVGAVTATKTLQYRRVITSVSPFIHLIKYKLHEYVYIIYLYIHIYLKRSIKTGYLKILLNWLLVSRKRTYQLLISVHRSVFSQLLSSIFNETEKGHLSRIYLIVYVFCVCVCVCICTQKTISV